MGNADRTQRDNISTVKTALRVDDMLWWAGTSYISSYCRDVYGITPSHAEVVTAMQEVVKENREMNEYQENEREKIRERHRNQ